MYLIKEASQLFNISRQLSANRYNMFTVQKLTEMKDLWTRTTNAAKDRLKDLKVHSILVAAFFNFIF